MGFPFLSTFGTVAGCVSTTAFGVPGGSSPALMASSMLLFIATAIAFALRCEACAGVSVLFLASRLGTSATIFTPFTNATYRNEGDGGGPTLNCGTPAVA